MKGTRGLIIAALTFALSGGWAFAQGGNEGENNDLDLTITLMPEDAELPDVVTADITLPTDEDGNNIAADEGVENSADGLWTANQAREDGRAFGEAAAAAAEANREDFGRGSIPNLEDLLPDQAPEVQDEIPGADVPETPDLPETPAS